MYLIYKHPVDKHIVLVHSTLLQSIWDFIPPRSKEKLQCTTTETEADLLVDFRNHLDSLDFNSLISVAKTTVFGLVQI